MLGILCVVQNNGCLVYYVYFGIMGAWYTMCSSECVLSILCNSD